MTSLIFLPFSHLPSQECDLPAVSFRPHVGEFMESYDFKGKTVIPFATSGGSSIKKACEDLKAAYPDVNWKEGKLLNRASKQELETWVKGL